MEEDESKLAAGARSEGAASEDEGTPERAADAEVTRADAEAALDAAVRIGDENAARAAARVDASREALGGALARIGAEAATGAAAREELNALAREATALQAEQRAALNAVRAELTAAVPEPTAEAPSSPIAGWSAEERAGVSAYLDRLDAADQAHATLAKAKRELKKITDTETDEWEIKADEVTELDKRWNDAKKAAVEEAKAIGPLKAQLTDLDAGRKAGRDGLRKLLENAPPPPLRPTETTETETAASEDQVATVETPLEENPESEAALAERERTERETRAFEAFYRGVDENGSHELAVLQDVSELLLAVVRGIDDRSLRNRDVAALRDDLTMGVHGLVAWTDTWAAELSAIEGERDEWKNQTPEERRRFLAARSHQAEEAEAQIRVLNARMEERFEEAEQLAGRDARNDPDGIVTRVIADIRDQFPNAVRIVVEKRDAIDSLPRRLAS